MRRAPASARIDRRSFLAAAAGLAAFPILAACRSGDDNPAEVAGATVTEGTRPPAADTDASPSATPAPSVELDPDLHVLVSKRYALPADYVPPELQALPANWLAPSYGGELRADVIEALQPMMSAAWQKDEVDLRIRSAYRSYATQQETFAFWVARLGEAQARRESAEPGHSEHQLGTVIDFADPANGWELVESFADSTSGLWLAEHAWEYGFAMSYPRDGEEITGYIFEPWHFRYIGIEAAAAWRASGRTLIEFLEGLHAS